MKNLYVMGTPGSGKTSAGLGLALKFRQEGLRVAYFKPVGSPAAAASREDEDAVLMKQVLRMEQPLENIVPYMAGPNYLSGRHNSCESMKTIRAAYESVVSGNDMVIIGGAGFPHIMGCLGLDAASLAQELTAVPVFVIRIENDYSLDHAIFINSYMQCKGVPVYGNIFHNVPRPLQAKTQGIYRPVLEEFGYRTLGVVPSQPEITSPSVKEYYDVLGGEVLAGGDKMDRIVEDIVIGAMTAESALGYLRRAANKAVITGGDRSAVALAALETNTSALILTGGLYPDVKVVARAEQKGVPLILVHLDTYTTIEKMSEVTRRIRADDEKAVNMALANTEKHIDWRGILKALQ
ncbi:phosphotransacetylase family protein [Pelotomaculum propionicicum]|uniref:Phosphate acetyltransferase n=1 Tax=Pelotomaculum propionicicum TaxID=258475 RepID=A0A4Y7RTN6_9FIRM|nr:phosphotransacetylase family protein [Pelotomaculum propionicicum]TEB12089.1 Phosphate acetyltransferase [Pelotomaculum propionicicum]